MSGPLLGLTLLPPLLPLLRRLRDDGLVQAVEVIPDRYLAPEGAPELLARQLELVGLPYSFHFTSFCLGAADFLERHDLAQTRRALAGFAPLLLSDHLSAAVVGSFAFEGNLPTVHDEEAVAYVTENVQAVAALAPGVPFLVENIPCEFDFVESTLTPEAFTLEVVRASGCKLLLDLHNLYVHEKNRGIDAEAFLAAVPPEAVLEIHLAGGTTFAPSGEYLDGHCSRVPDRVFSLLAAALQRFSPRLVVLERERDLDDAAGIRADLERARDVMA